MATASNTSPLSATQAVFAAKCPVCREGKVFRNSALSTKGFLVIHENCPVCGTKFEPEPGFFWGAMYVNYAFNLLMIIGIGLFLLLVVGTKNEWVYIGTILTAIFLSIPFTARASRILWMYWFGSFHYDPKLAGARKKEASGQA